MLKKYIYKKLLLYFNILLVFTLDIDLHALFISIKMRFKDNKTQLKKTKTTLKILNKCSVHFSNFLKTKRETIIIELTVMIILNGI